MEVYNETMMVSDPVGHRRSRFLFPEFTPTAPGLIRWTATIADDDPDVDEATTVTWVTAKK
jgi:hypothetical protein